MSPVQALLDELAAECGRLLDRVGALSEENRSLSEQLLAAGGGAGSEAKKGHAHIDLENSDEGTCRADQPGSKSSSKYSYRADQPGGADGDQEGVAGGVAAPGAEQDGSASNATCEAGRKGDRKRTLEQAKSGTSLQKEKEVLEMWPLWLDDFNAEGTNLKTAVPQNVNISMASSDNLTQRNPDSHVALQGDRVMSNSCLQSIVCGPTNRKRLMWDLLSVVCLSYDLLMLPLAAFGEVDRQIVIYVLNIFTTCFWAMDMVTSFFTGYYIKGLLEMRPGKIALRYLKYWFLLDAILITVDVMLLMVVQDSVSSISFLRFGKLTRFARVLRIFRLVRVFKVLFILNKQSELLKSDMARTCFTIVQLMLAIALANHFVACGWYAIGTWDSVPADTPTWVQSLKQKDEEFGDRHAVYFYTTALHWSFTQFTPASMEVVPRNPIERSYNIGVLLLGLVMFSSLISSITNAMTKLRERNAEREKQRELLSEFFHNQRISLSLGNHIYSFLAVQGYTVEKRVVEDDIPLLGKLPEKMRKRLHGEIHRPVLRMHPFFFLLDKSDAGTVLAVCHWAMSQQVILEGARLFHCGEPCGCTYFVGYGEMEYFHGTSDMATALIRYRDHVSEAALWANWEHRGRADAETVTELCVLDSMSFRAAVRQTRLLPFCRAYAQNFCTKMNEDGFSDVAFGVDELHKLTEEACELVREEALEEAAEGFGPLPPVSSSHLVATAGIVGSVMLNVRQRMADVSWSLMTTTMGNSRGLP